MPKRDFGQVATNRLEIIQSPLTILPSMEPLFAVTISGSGTIDTTGITTPMRLYKGTKDVSTTNLSGSISVLLRTITLKKIISLSPGDWAFYIDFNDDGIKTSRFCRFYVPKETA